MYKIILFYNFTKIENLPMFCAEHRRQCQFRNLLGRVYLAEEGINGTLAGLVKDIDDYEKYLISLEGFERTLFKEDTSDKIPFVKLVVKSRKELATLKSSMDIDFTEEKGKHLSPQEWKKILDSKEDIQLLDVRNRYEYDVGHFEGAIKMDVKNFSDSEKWLDDAGFDKSKKTLMYCTGGIRCEKFSVLLEKKGFRDVNQLDGGILNYEKEMGDEHYKGKCFVFDDRLTVPIEKNQNKPLGVCKITGDPSDQYLNCANPDCNQLFICTPKGAAVYEGCCGEECYKSERRRPFDPNNIYEPSRKWYTYYPDEDVGSST